MIDGVACRRSHQHDKARDDWSDAPPESRLRGGGQDALLAAQGSHSAGTRAARPLVLPPPPGPGYTPCIAGDPQRPRPTPSGPTPLPLALVRYQGCTPSGPTPLPMALVTPLALPETPSAPGPIGLLPIV